MLKTAKNILRCFCAVLCAVFVLIPALNVFALNPDYLDADKWKNNGNITITDIEKTSNSINGKTVLKGQYGYYADHSEMCLYNLFAVDESTLNDKNCSVMVGYKFTTASEEYEFFVDENGITQDSPAEEKNAFTAAANLKNRKNGSFLSAAQYCGKEGICTVDVILYVNGHRYSIMQGMTLERPTTVKTTTTKLTTVKSTTVKTTKPTTVKAKVSTKKSEKINKASTTKYSPKKRIAANVGTNGADGNTKYETTGYEENIGKYYSPSDSEEVSEETLQSEVKKAEYTTHFSKPAIVMAIIALVLCTAGITLLIVAAVTKSRENKADENKDENKDIKN